MADSPGYSITYDNKIKAVVCVWKGYSNSWEFREGTEKYLSLLVQKKVSKMLVDLKEMILIGKEDQDWMDRSYLPKAVEEGLKAVAVVQPDYYFNKVAVESILFKLNMRPVQVNYFKTFEEAKEWLSMF
ncbi:STAS/SEC14 domain-containing protein [Flavobacterium sp. UBA7680]|uniref:STAS/SEC14 domain-containing protein n=1 Tax=Flavobacterium sp. UBA7680 TaxID=1946559 RepID=UPI0025B7C908|nr:STAS/SEC14 domain-containing protein [Flavobacterium sp. UBA7680]